MLLSVHRSMHLNPTYINQSIFLVSTYSRLWREAYGAAYADIPYLPMATQFISKMPMNAFINDLHSIEPISNIKLTMVTLIPQHCKLTGAANTYEKWIWSIWPFSTALAMWRSTENTHSSTRNARINFTHKNWFRCEEELLILIDSL